MTYLRFGFAICIAAGYLAVGLAKVSVASRAGLVLAGLATLILLMAWLMRWFDLD